MAARGRLAGSDRHRNERTILRVFEWHSCPLTLQEEEEGGVGEGGGHSQDHSFCVCIGKNYCVLAVVQCINFNEEMTKKMISTQTFLRLDDS